ncbi:helix-turn-helix domain-containing protein [Halobellus clavatus]|jgi:predicted DNA binding protein|uniref:HTH DNA binding domain-containing protein n=1 Tax=Halobellus clavatus TaxID=660517 RepID=A0A1H3DGF7_9EURY|nr:helix-turn-helix domain-containing protein [Halobellus clavatus]SDX64784.1 HTH DNA binding domain-containing protein [Halobellus clavatus]
MQSVRLRLGLPEPYVHPMHAFVADTPGFRETRLRHWNPAVGERNTLVFFVDGDDRAAYTEALVEQPSILEYEVAPAAGRRGFHLAVTEDQRSADARLTAAFLGTGVVVVPPIVYRADRLIDVSLVGTGEELTAALEGLPDEIDIDVERVRPYDGRLADPTAALTPRQRAALDVAVEVGYYASPREATLDAVADELGCAPGTAAEHLRKAEATVLGRIVDSVPGART